MFIVLMEVEILALWTRSETIGAAGKTCPWNIGTM